MTTGRDEALYAAVMDYVQKPFTGKPLYYGASYKGNYIALLDVVSGILLKEPNKILFRNLCRGVLENWFMHLLKEYIPSHHVAMFSDYKLTLNNGSFITRNGNEKGTIHKSVVIYHDFEYYHPRHRLNIEDAARSFYVVCITLRPEYSVFDNIIALVYAFPQDGDHACAARIREFLKPPMYQIPQIVLDILGNLR